MHTPPSGDGLDCGAAATPYSTIAGLHITTCQSHAILGLRRYAPRPAINDEGNHARQGRPNARGAQVRRVNTVSSQSHSFERGRGRPAVLTWSSEEGLARSKVKEILFAPEDSASLVGNRVLVKGWVRTIRSQKTFSFIEINDGSTLGGLQIVADSSKVPGYEGVVGAITTGAAIGAVGRIKESPGKGQKYEVRPEMKPPLQACERGLTAFRTMDIHTQLDAEEIEVIGVCDGEQYPLQKKRHTLEFLRSIAHLRPRTNTIGAVARVRSALAYATHRFFQDRGFYYLQVGNSSSVDIVS
jgi:hypothetical protein